ncbi:unnamed protein product [Mytilus edulis]|uniref:Uncharacterized protein n=1 Tax=Mytilus edulis TaxID=6550 RepID=A0A8S3VN24_MYTED|nr:unnamed protein product [Mytilus edulis]
MTKKYGYCVKRLTEKLIKENRIKARRLGAGARPMLDSDDEEFIANAIESKSSAHGRRQDTVLYLNHRVKLEDLLSIANYNLIRRGKKLLKSAKTVHLRARPRKINTIEGKRHKGIYSIIVTGSFVPKIPSKTEDHSTELTHHQRAHVKLNREDMFSTNSLFRYSSLDISFDDKAYIRPGTDVGLRDTKAGKILTLTDESRQRKLPQHDFATPEVYQSPSSFRLMTWKTETIQGKERLIKDHDQSCVVVRPKFYVGSSGCVWGSDLLRLRYEKPDLFEMSPERGESIQDKQFYAMVHDAAFYVFDSTTDDDLTSLLSGQSNYTHYESERITHFARRLERVLANFPNTGPDELIDKLKEALQLIEKLNQDLKGENMRICNRNLKTLRDQCEEIIRSIDSMNIYPVKPVISEYTDGGPGVGVNNTAVKFRFAEMCRIQNSVRRVRIHRASGDSAQNEAERTNSAIGDALVDGATICWEYFKPLHGLSQEDQDAMTPSDLDKHKAAMMEKNAWAVAEVVSLRIDDAKGPAGFIQAYVTEHPEDQFFWNGNYLKRYHESSKSAKATHCEVGELYIEYRKYRCEQSHGTKCEYCLRSPVNDLYGPNLVKPVPRPYPDYERLPDLHYLVHSNTPVQIDNVEREPDDFQPRANIKKLFALGELSTSNHASVSQFSKKYVLPDDLVMKYVLHLETLKADKEKRSIATQKKET